MKIKDYIRKFLIKLPFALTENIRTDQRTNLLLSQILRQDSNCIDVGCHKGEIMDEIIKNAPNGHHYGFEPIPYLYNSLVTKYKGDNITLFPYALSNIDGQSQFNLVITNPAYSGLVKRHYDRIEKDTIIDVEVMQLDKIISQEAHIDFIKIDTEGAEMLVLEGAKKLIARCKPTILFEFGIGASDVYGTEPIDIYQIMQSCNLSIFTLKDFVSKNKHNLTLEQFSKIYFDRLDYIFIATP